MTMGEKIKVRHVNGVFRYILDVEVTAICPSDEFKGRVERVFSDWGDRGEVTGSEELDSLRGQERTFKNEDVVPALND
jgi:hypothetical protein